MKELIRSYIQARSRAAKFEEFYGMIANTNTASILDVGVSDLKKHQRRDAANLFLKTFRYPPHCYTGLAVEDMTGMSDVFPGKRFVTYDGRDFPFGNDVFDAVFSNAVVEHVGDRERQLHFINELIRVGKKVYFTTPNKWFPVETHTNVYFLHWHTEIFLRWCRCRHVWVNQYNPRLLGFRDLVSLMDESSARNYNITKNSLLGIPMTFSVVCE